MCFIYEAELVFFCIYVCVCVCVCVWGGGAILATFQPNFLNPLVLMCGCLDRQIDTFFNEGFI